MQRPCTTKGHKRKISGVQASLDGHQSDAARHALVHHGQDGLSGLFHAQPKLGSQIGHRTARAFATERADLDLPRFLAPGDRALATLELHNVEGKAGNYTAVVQGQGGVLGFFRRLYTLALGQRAVERIPIEAPARAGVGKVSFEVKGPGFAYPHSWDIQTRQGWGAETRVVTELRSEEHTSELQSH